MTDDGGCFGCGGGLWEWFCFFITAVVLYGLILRPIVKFMNKPKRRR